MVSLLMDESKFVKLLPGVSPSSALPDDSLSWSDDFERQQNSFSRTFFERTQKKDTISSPWTALAMMKTFWRVIWVEDFWGTMNEPRPTPQIRSNRIRVTPIPSISRCLTLFWTFFDKKVRIRSMMSVTRWTTITGKATPK